jgi:hypothetical protein
MRSEHNPPLPPTAVEVRREGQPLAGLFENALPDAGRGQHPPALVLGLSNGQAGGNTVRPLVTLCVASFKDMTWESQEVQRGQ